MGVQIFEDRKDRQFWVIGSALDVNPATVVQDVQRRCRPSSIKFVMITSVEALWLRMLAPLAPYFFHRYLKPELALVWLDQTNILMSIPKHMSIPKQGSNLATLAKAVGTILDRESTDLLDKVHVVTSLDDHPMPADYQYRKLVELRAKAQEFGLLQDTTNAILKAMSESLTTAARKN